MLFIFLPLFLKYSNNYSQKKKMARKRSPTIGSFIKEYETVFWSTCILMSVMSVNLNAEVHKK